MELTAVTVLLGNFPALARCNFSAYEGEVVLISGANGSGKTTLLRTIAGLVRIHSGSGAVFGVGLRDEVGRRTVRQSVSYLAHGSHLYDDLTVEENLRFIARGTKTDWSDIESMCERMQLPKRIMNLEVAHTSAGQRKKVTLVATLAQGSELVLLDEPHAALDSEAKEIFDRYVAEMASSGATMLVASHDQGRVEAFATRTAEVRGGRVVDQKS
ncbi:MAG: ABC transporter ATP-binding protein [Acidimicrobiales bacterium]